MLRNFRDIGGLPSRLGGRTRSGRVYRSAQPAGLEPADLARALAYDFALIADLRHPAEQANSPSPWPDHWAPRVVRHGMEEAGMQAPHEALLALRPRHIAEIDDFYLDLYERLPFDAAYRRVFAETLNALPGLSGPLLVHCTAGKDRTGMLVGVILAVLGVPHEEIMTDFLRSGTANDFGGGDPAVLARVRTMFGFDVAPAVLDRLISVQPSYLPRFFETVETKAGGLDAWLDAIGVGASRRQALKDALLEP
jgi:protein-tyrosine phosphatase